jgi:hypothetical protein
MDVVNHFGEHMWLKRMPPEPPHLSHGYITDCCFIDEPCDHHAKLPRPKCDRAACLHDEAMAHEAHLASGLLTEVQTS